MSQQTETETDKLLRSEVRVVNIGLREFARDLETCEVPVVHVDWSPPAASNPQDRQSARQARRLKWPHRP